MANKTVKELIYQVGIDSDTVNSVNKVENSTKKAIQVTSTILELLPPPCQPP